MKNYILLLFIISISGYGQSKLYARKVLDTLCSSHFDGRGYFNKGEKRAADFIKNEYEKIGLQAVNKKYLQRFNLSVNSIVGELSLKVNKKQLKAGADYIVHPSSVKYKGKSAVYYLSKETLINLEAFKEQIPFFKNKFVVVDKTLIKDESKGVKGQVSEIIEFLKYTTAIPLNGVIEVVRENLTYTASQTKAARSHIILLKNKVPKKFKSLQLIVNNEFNSNHESQNVIGIIEGEIKDEFIYVTAHYDHLGRMGDAVYFPGANDNASGIAMLLSLAKEFSLGEKPKHSIVFVAFGSEEIGLLGSKYYTDNPVLPLDKIQFLINLDILGTGDDGIQVVNGSKYKERFNELVKLNDDKELLKEVKIRGEACNSDHCFFNEKGVPSFFIYTLGGIAHYHNVYDKPETLPLTEFEDLFLLLKDFIVNLK